MQQKIMDWIADNPVVSILSLTAIVIILSMMLVKRPNDQTEIEAAKLKAQSQCMHACYARGGGYESVYQFTEPDGTVRQFCVCNSEPTFILE
jgi:hypothetical protein